MSVVLDKIWMIEPVSMDKIELIEKHREIIQRLSAVSLTDVTVDQAIVATALEKFLKALNRPVVPVRWARDGRDAAGLVGRAEQIIPIHNVKTNPSTFREWFIRKEPNWRNARDEALVVAQSDVLQFVRDELLAANRAANPEAWSAFGSALHFAACAAAECVWAREYHETEKRFRQYEIGDFEEDWFPFVDAYEAGLWLFWLTDAEVIALSRPIIKLRDQQVHSDRGPSVWWPEGEEQYFVLNGTPVPRDVVEAPAADLDARLILSVEDAKVRREIVRKIGLERVCQGLDAKCIDREGEYELLMLDLQDELRHPFLRMKDLSTGICHVEGVAPECTTVAEALAWRNQTEVPPNTFREQRVGNNYHWYQQGDVTIKPVPKIPHRGALLSHRVLAEGTATEYKHVAEAGDVRLFLHEETLFMRAPTGTAVTHRENDVLQLPPGDYVVGRVRAYDHFPEAEADHEY